LNIIDLVSFIWLIFIINAFYEFTHVHKLI